MTAARLKDLAEISEQGLICRDEGHHWTHVTDELLTGHYDNRVISYTQVRICGCGTVRRRTVSVPSLSIERTTYVYPDNYLIARQRDSQGTGSPAAGQFRRSVRSLVLDRMVSSRTAVIHQERP